MFYQEFLITKVILGVIKIKINNCRNFLSPISYQNCKHQKVNAIYLSYHKTNIKNDLNFSLEATVINHVSYDSIQIPIE